MLRPNAAAAAVARAHGVRAATDVTGFGLVGHLREMAAASGLEGWIDPAAVPALPGAPALAADGIVTGGGGRNRQQLAACAEWDPAVPEPLRVLLHDPQTSGGLLLAVAPAVAGAVARDLRAAGAGAHAVGALRAGAPGRVVVAPAPRS
jgi:selenide,water dikinase